jgi:hypothetical protein
MAGSNQAELYFDPAFSLFQSSRSNGTVGRIRKDDNSAKSEKKKTPWDGWRVFPAYFLIRSYDLSSQAALTRNGNHESKQKFAN